MTDRIESPHGAPSPNHETPVLEIDASEITRYPNGDALPAMWITSDAHDCGDGLVKRSYVCRYSGGDDPHGDDALCFGSWYYEEGMSYMDAADLVKRIECFQAAELLYRHSAAHGNATADLCLGYVYSYDRCEGRYWDSAALSAWDGATPYPREERAFECLTLAAAAGIPEACYKLGDMYKNGLGCDPDALLAFHWYSRASGLAKRETPVVLGSIALRLAGCYEEGLGCSQDFARALEWYRQAVSALEIAVEAGETWYEKVLAGARAGEKRCAQECG